MVFLVSLQARLSLFVRVYLSIYLSFLFWIGVLVWYVILYVIMKSSQKNDPRPRLVLDNLESGKTYHYQIPGVNGTTTSDILSFATAQKAGAASDGDRPVC